MPCIVCGMNHVMNRMWNESCYHMYLEKKNQGTNENHLGAIFRNFSNFIFRQNFMTKNIMEKQEFTVPLGV